MSTDSYDLGHFFYLTTGQGRPEVFGYELWVILHALRPVTSDPESLDYKSPEYNPVISDEELSNLQIQFHHLDIETGDVSPSSIPCFLPKTDLPEVLDGDDFYPNVFDGVEKKIVSLKECGWSETSTISSSDIFPDCLWYDLVNFSFEKNDDYALYRKFTDPGGPNIYGWIDDDESFKGVFLASIFNDGERVEVLRMVPSSQRTIWRKKLGTPDQQTYRWALAELRTCGDNSRPSRDEVAALACTMLDCMWQANPSIHEEQSRRDDMFPTLLITLDSYGRSRVLAGYFDGQLHIQFSRILDFEEYAVEPPKGTPYIDVIDRRKFYDMLNILAKWSWPIPVANTKENDPVILDLPTDDRPDTDTTDEDWLLV
ncbi:hypothetical protein F1880_004323 [Penicillium rolfsii]|nr:hypothetical protein F1880_004323 [Penicillium rolfsii]